MLKTVKVLIVDDERLVRISIKKLVDWDKLGAEVIAEAKNVQEAMEKVNLLGPDIVITDMKMPGIDGAAFMELLARDFPQIKIIVISGYDDFVYMRSAIKNKAVDYIMKPIDKAQLNNAISNAIDEINHVKKDYDSLTREKLVIGEKIERIMLEKRLNELLNDGRISKSEIVKDKSLSMLYRKNLKYVFLLFKFFNIHYICKNNFNCDYNEMTLRICECIDSCIENKNKIVFKKEHSFSEFCIIIGYGKSAENDRITESAALLAEKIDKNVSSQLNLKSIAGVSNIHNSFDALGTMYQESLFALMHINIKDSAIISFYDKSVKQISKHVNIIENGNKWGIAIESGNCIMVKNLLNEALGILMEKSVICPQDIINLYREIFYYVERTLRKLNLETIDAKIDDLLDEDYLVLIFIEAVKQGKLTFPEVNRIIMERLEQCIEKVLLSKRMKTHSNLYEVKDFIDKYYYEDITLEKLSSMFHFSKGYLSRAFKDEFGQNISSYITNVRLNNAMEYLQQGNLKISEIMRLTGFNSLNYFCKVFKKRFGKTPSKVKSQECSGL
ncbi:MAG: response regulator [Clostridiaceae bacterium]|nr:response regulator [Clostridiaceae bacterium]